VVQDGCYIVHNTNCNKKASGPPVTCTWIRADKYYYCSVFYGDSGIVDLALVLGRGN